MDRQRSSAGSAIDAKGPCLILPVPVNSVQREKKIPGNVLLLLAYLMNHLQARATLSFLFAQAVLGRRPVGPALLEIINSLF